MIISAVFFSAPILLQTADSRLSDARKLFQVQSDTHVAQDRKMLVLPAHSMLLPSEKRVVLRFVLINGNHPLGQVLKFLEIFRV